MTDKTISKELLKGHIKADTTNWKAQARERRDNRHWANRSQKIAVRILNTLRDREMQQKDLAAIMGVAPQQVSKWVKGKENFTLDTVGRIEKALGIHLLQVPLVIKEEVPVKGPGSSSKKVKSLEGPKVIKLSPLSGPGMDKIA